MKIIALAPTRISLFGGGTDLPVFYEKHGGRIISMAINIRQHITLSSEPITYKIPLNASENFYQAFFDEMELSDYYMAAEFDAVIESGLGSSASAAVALVGAINRVKDLKLTKKEIAEKAWDIEVNKLKLYGGKQDQISTSFGGVNYIKFSKQRILVTPLYRELAENLADHTLLFYTGNNRKNTKIQEQLKELSQQQVEALYSLKNSCQEAYEYFQQGKFKEIGSLLAQSWHYKKKSNPQMTTAKIDKLYKMAMKNGAWGGKLCGSGGGGYMIFMAPKKNHERLITALEYMGAEHIDFSIDWTGLETRLL